MSAYVSRWATAASLVALGATAAVAQGSRPWVDPPGTVTAPSQPSAAPSDETVTLPPYTPNKTVTAGQDAVDQTGAIQTRVPRVIAPKPQTPRTEQAERTRRATVTAAAKGRDGGAEKQVVVRSRVPAPEPRIAAPLPAQDKRFKTVRDALDAGYQLATIRTIEFPDGRRVRVMTRTDPAMEPDLLDRPY